MNVVIFASDAKGLSSLNSIIHEAGKQGIRLFAMVTQSTQLRHPKYQQNHYQILCNVDRKKVVWSDSLGIDLPFKPDLLIVNRERWDPESSIISEFKNKFKSKVALVEPNAWIFNGAESRLETYSRNKYVNSIDVFFMGSKHGILQQQTAGFEGNMVAVGNPKYDLNTNIPQEQIDQLREVYKAPQDKENVLLFSLVNGHRDKINNIFKQYTKDTSKRYFYKPYPGEPFDTKFANEYKPKFFLDNTLPILDEQHIWGMFEICDTHVGVLSSIVHATLLKGKKYIDHSLELGLPEKYLDFSGVFQTGGPGLENNKSMWMNSFGFTNENQLKALLPDSYRDKIEKTNNQVWDNLDNPEKLLILFDDYNDGQASKRIINYIQNEL
jgi:hypothetical protein